MKVHEIAAELRLQSKEVLAKAAEIGVDAKNHMSNLSDGDTMTLKNALRGGNVSTAAPVRVKVPIKSNTPVPKKAEEPKPTGKGKAEAETEETADVDDDVPFVPRRITKQQLEEEELAKQKDTDEDASEESSAEAKPVKKEKAQLKVAYTDVSEDVPATKAASDAPVETSDEEKTEATEPVSTKEEAATPETPVADAETKEESEVVEVRPTEEKSEAKAQPIAEPEQAQTTKAPAEKPAKADAPEATRPAKPADAKQGQPKPGQPKAGQGKPDGKPDEKAKENAAKSKDKKHPNKDSKRPLPNDRKKHPQTADRKRRPGEDFKGSAKSPILEDNSLEKRPLRSRPRPKTQQKGPEAPAFNLDDLAPGTKIMSVPITVAGFAEQVERSTSEIILTLMKLGIMANINQNLDETTALLLAEELSLEIYIASDEGDIIEEGIEDVEDQEEDLEPRPPIITVMGHVDHGKTSLLDAIRKTNVTSGEAGGITQHIGAYEVTINGEKIVFLDTPGHEAFTAMRARGAHVTDIAVLVVAADDGVMPQTIESISHAKAAGVPMIVAINKIDKEGANLDRVMKELSDHGVLVETWGGDTISVPVSAKSGEGITNLLEMILLQAEVLELKANPNRPATGTVIEAYLDKSRGSVATLLVQNGTLSVGMSVVVGTTSGRIRAMTDYKGRRIKKALPSTAIEITGLSEVPEAGDAFNALTDDRVAREIAETRRLRQRDEIMARTSGASLETLFSRISEENMKELNIIIKGDVQGSVGALTASLEKLSNENVKVRILHTGVGTVNESDVMLAGTSDSIIIGFNVRPSTAVSNLADQQGVEIRTYRVIYDAINEVESAMKGMLDPEYKEVVLGKIEVRETFKVPGAGVIGGSYVLEGKVQRNAQVRIVRDGIVIHEGKISSLRRFKDDVKEVSFGYECGIGIENYNDIKQGDIIEAFVMEEIIRE
ncbi:MAG: translation initiation factor IF-2 [Clostridiales Family XIII bacterium]|jgi:translation initiation factor IF-2|nr:translation initiation factor IF-2 [Clostridiales Family XIII bacterium]